jgi:hypothetical protein
MNEEASGRLRDAAEELIAAVAGIDVAAMPATDLYRLGDELEEIGRLLGAAATISLARAGDAGPDRLSHPLRRVDE